jgi:hypothetical protein
MSKMMERIRSRRTSDRQARAIARALRDAPSSALRRELMEIVNRYE